MAWWWPWSVLLSCPLPRHEESPRARAGGGVLADQVVGGASGARDRLPVGRLAVLGSAPGDRAERGDAALVLAEPRLDRVLAFADAGLCICGGAASVAQPRDRILDRRRRREHLRLVPVI